MLACYTHTYTQTLNKSASSLLYAAPRVGQLQHHACSACSSTCITAVRHALCCRLGRVIAALPLSGTAAGHQALQHQAIPCRRCAGIIAASWLRYERCTPSALPAAGALPCACAQSRAAHPPSCLQCREQTRGMKCSGPCTKGQLSLHLGSRLTKAAQQCAATPLRALHSLLPAHSTGQGGAGSARLARLMCRIPADHRAPAVAALQLCAMNA